MRERKDVPHKMKFKILDLFCGAGGFSYGLEKNSSFKTLIGVDFDEHAIKTFQHNFKDSIGIVGDLTDPNVRNEIINESKKLGINMVIGGPPCQGFSLKGKKLGLDDPRNFLFLEFVKIVEELKPEVFIIENVKQLLHAQEGYFLQQIRMRFKNLDYIINDGFLNAKNFGVPQNRERTFIIGSKSRSVDLPKPMTLKFSSVRDAISDLSYLESGEGKFESEYKDKPESKYQGKLRAKKLYNHIATNHSDIAITKLKLVPPEGDKSSIPVELRGKQKFSTTWSRLKWDSVSPTIDTRFDTPSNGRNSHPYLNRSITPREAARIQSFDDSFVFLGQKTSVCRQIGNAVPPLLAKSIGDHIIGCYSDLRVQNGEFTIYLNDSFVFFKELAKSNIKINHIITDPPYNISKNNNLSTMKGKRQGVDFGSWDKNFDLFGWIRNYTPLLDENGSIIIFCSYLFISDIVKELTSNQIDVKDIIVWKKTNPMPRNIERRYVQDMEFAIWGVKAGSKWVFNRPNNVSYLRSSFETSLVSGKERKNHPTQKSLFLMEQLVKIHTNEGDLILDPFMGTGTTGVAAVKNNRKFIGIEINTEYFKISENRLSEIKKP